MIVETAATDVKPRKRKVKRARDPLSRAPDSSPAAKARRRGTTCSRCDTKHEDANGNPTCNAHLHGVRPWKPCGRRPKPGAAVCVKHGGNAQHIKDKAALRVAWDNTEGQVAALLSECDLPEQHPIDGLLEVVRHSGAMMRMLGTLVAQLDLNPGEVRIAYNEHGDARRYTSSEDGIFGYSHQGDQATHILVTMYGMWADRYARACKLALDANIDERLVRNAEATSNAVYLAITRALEKANLTPIQAAEFSKTLADEMRKLVGPLEGKVNGQGNSKMLAK